MGNTAFVEETHIDWGSASVHDGQLTVPLTGKPSREWRERVQSVLERLHQGGTDWGAITVGKKKVTVEEVGAGSESDLRHLLESAVLQANADVEADDDTSDEDDERSAADHRATDAFRAFAENQEGAES
jgi:hypothetical protein